MDENRVFSTRHSLRLLFILCLVIKLKWCYSFIYTHANTYTERIYKISIYYRWSTSNIGTRTIVAIVSRVRWHSWQWYRWRDRIKKIEAKSEFHGVLRTHTMRQHTKLFRVSHSVFFFVCSVRLEIYNSVWNTNGTNYARFHYSRLVWYNSSTSRTTRNSNGKLYWFHDDYTILCLDRVVKDIKHSFRNYGTKGSRF